MARISKVIGVLLLCVALTQPSYAFPLYGCDCCDDCAECGYIRYPDEPLLPLHVIQPGLTCNRCQSLPYQLQAPLPPPIAPCGQQFGVRVEIPHTPLPCKPCLNLGYELEAPVTPFLPKLPNLPVSVTVPYPQLPCHQPCHVNYELEAPVLPCAPLLTNLKTQVDRVVLPCPCPPPILDGYVPKSGIPQTGRCKRSVESPDSGCDCGCCDDDDDEDYEDDCVDDRTYSRCRRSPSNPRAFSYNRRIELFPTSRTPKSPREEWLNSLVAVNNFEDYEDDYRDDLDYEPVDVSPRSTRRRKGHKQRIVTPETEDLGNQESEDQDSEDRIVNRDTVEQDDQERTDSRDIGGQVYDYQDWRVPMTSDPVKKRWEDPSFGNRDQEMEDEMEQVRIENMLRSSRVPGNGPFPRRNGEAAIDDEIGALGTESQQRGRIQSTRSGGSQRNGRSRPSKMQSPPTTMRMNDSSRSKAKQSGPEDKITTPNTYGAGLQEQQVSQEENIAKSPIRAQMQGSQRHNGPQRQTGSRGQHDPPPQGVPRVQGGTRKRQGGSPVQIGAQQRQIDTTDQGGAQQRQGGSQKRQGGTQQRQGGSLTQDDPHQRHGSARQRAGSSQQRPGGPPGGPQRTGASSGQNSPRRQPSPGGTEMRTGQPNPGRGPIVPNQGREHCDVCDTRRSLPNNPYNLVLSTPDETIRFVDYLDYPGAWRPPPINIPPGRMPLSRQRTPQQPITPQTPLPAQIQQSPSHVQHIPGQNENISSNPQPPSPDDTSRIVSPKSYEEQPQYIDYY